MATPLIREAFVEELIALRDRYHTKNHSFFDAWSNGELTKEQMGRYMAQHFQLVREILRPFGVAYSRAPRDVQQFLIENLAEEHGRCSRGVSPGNRAGDAGTRRTRGQGGRCRTPAIRADLVGMGLVPGVEW